MEETTFVAKETTAEDSTLQVYTVADSNVQKPHFYRPVVLAQIILGTVGILSNLSVIVVFGTHVKCRKKIPVLFIINQVSVYFYSLKLLVECHPETGVQSAHSPTDFFCFSFRV